MSSTPDTYEYKITVFKYRPYDEFLCFSKKYFSNQEGEGNMKISWWINYLWFLLHVEALRDFDITETEKNVTTYAHLVEILQGLGKYFLLVNYLYKQKRNVPHNTKKRITQGM